MFSDEQIFYFKEYILLKNPGDTISRISSSLFESKITLNPHQINAALSFFKNPKKKGMIFADEVGLGKTIEAGLVISQYWYEQKRKILIICPASLIKQWNEELLNKFHLDSCVLDGKKLKDSSFMWEQKIYLASMNTVYLNKEKFGVKFDLIVIDEAHKLRNVYKNKGVMAPIIKELFAGQKKLLLTATPFQNNLQELYGLMLLVDEEIFPDPNVFREKYINNYVDNKSELNNILSNYIIRTLRKDVVKYINYTKRNVLLANYELQECEKEIYKRVDNLIYSTELYEIYGSGQLHLIILLLQKLLSSSIFAVKTSLKNIMEKLSRGECFNFIIDDDEYEFVKIENGNARNKFVNNIDECVSYIESVSVDSKLERLKRAIADIFREIEKDSCRNRKILIFTESKKTQEYLYEELLKEYHKILFFNGENSGEIINEIYKKWCSENIQNKNVSKSIGIRRAIVDAFEKEYEIMIATDAAAEGLNLQFCSVVINYDLPWNPQKIEQRIGRCHRYGQKNDVIVINLLNNSSNIDKRIYELLSGKLGVFQETFGSSDLILGSTNLSESIEDAIRNIYRSCRSPEEIERSFEELQSMFKEEIESAIKASENALELYFDEEVSNAFDLQYVEATRIVNEMEELFYNIVKYCLPNATFYDKQFAFEVDGLKRTVTTKHEDIAEFCSISSDFGKELLDTVLPVKGTEFKKIVLDYSNSNKKIGYINQVKKKEARIIVSKITYDSYEISEALVLTAMFNDGTIIPEEICHKILKLPCLDIIVSEEMPNDELHNAHEDDVKKKIFLIEKYNANVFQEELEYIDNWADSMIEKVQLSVKEMREERKRLQISYDLTNSIDEKAKLQELIYKISKKINKSWIELAKLEDKIEERRYNLISNLKAEKDKSINITKLFEVGLYIQ